MRTRYVFATALLCTVTAVACGDDAPTASTGAPGSAMSASRHGERHADGRARGESVTLPPVGAFVSTPLSRGSFDDPGSMMLRLKEDHRTEVVQADDLRDMVMASISIPANTSLPWHSHPGPAFVTVTAGTLTLVDGESCELRTYGAGDAFIDAGQGHVHSAYAGSAPTTVYVTYVGVPAGASPLIPTTNPGC